jgi:5-methylcytosine-specific restriction endonuclease McrA
MKRRKLVYEKYDGHCAYCGEKLKLGEMQVDHLIPKRNFVSYVKRKIHIPEFLKHLTEKDVNHIDNLYPSCRVCNKWKDSYHLELFRSEIASQIHRLNAYSANFRFAKKYGLVKENNIPIIFYFETFKF